jgi:hypothetical protein
LSGNPVDNAPFLKGGIIVIKTATGEASCLTARLEASPVKGRPQIDACVKMKKKKKYYHNRIFLLTYYLVWVYIPLPMKKCYPTERNTGTENRRDIPDGEFKARIVLRRG